jgi:hypothetical protein
LAAGIFKKLYNLKWRGIMGIISRGNSKKNVIIMDYNSKNKTWLAAVVLIIFLINKITGF